jgi:hypothetical protein
MIFPHNNWTELGEKITVIHYLQEQEGIHLEVKARKVA